jgi:hypothetical protein
MNWQTGNPTTPGMYLARLEEQCGYVMVTYAVLYYGSGWHRAPGQTVTHYCEIVEPIVTTNLHNGPLGKRTTIDNS